MATASEVKAGLDEIARAIRSERARAVGAKGQGETARGNLDALPTQYSDVIATVDAYGTSDAFEANAKAELAKLTAEFIALRAGADAIATTELD